MVLAAGRGTRLASIGLDIPKPLVEVGGRPLLQAQIEYLASEGIERIVVNAHHRAESIEAFVRTYRAPADVIVVREPELLGTAGGVRNVLAKLGKTSFFVLYGDVVIDEPLAPIAEAHHARAAEATVTVYESDAVQGKGIVLADDRGWVRRFVEKPAARVSPALINAGLYLLERRFVADLPAERELDFGHDVFPAALARGSHMLAYRLAAPVIDVGTPESLALARAHVSERH